MTTMADKKGIKLPQMPSIPPHVKTAVIGVAAAGGLFAAANGLLPLVFHQAPVVTVKGDNNSITVSARDMGPDVEQFCKLSNTKGVPGRPTVYGTNSLVLQNAAAQTEVEWKGVGESVAFRVVGQDEIQAALTPEAKACLIQKTGGVVGAPAKPLAQ